MDYKKLFHLLVVSGAVAGAAAACDPQTDPAPKSPSGRSGVSSTVLADGGVEVDDGGVDKGGGVEGW